MIFPFLELEDKIQVNDKTRLYAGKSFITPDENAVSLVEIEPFTGAGFIDVTNDDPERWYLDFQYATDGVKTVSIRITTDGAPTTETKDILVLDAGDDLLFSSDNNLIAHEQDIMKYVRNGRNTFKDIHRRSQELILQYFDEQRIYKEDGSKILKGDLHDIEEVREWSVYQTLVLIMKSLTVSPDDIFDTKAKAYEQLLINARNRSAIKFDYDGDNVVDEDERRDIRTTTLWRI